jgi:hypothetical protein
MPHLLSAEKRRSLGRYISLAVTGHGVHIALVQRLVERLLSCCLKWNPRRTVDGVTFEWMHVFNAMTLYDFDSM